MYIYIHPYIYRVTVVVDQFVNIVGLMQNSRLVRFPPNAFVSMFLFSVVVWCGLIFCSGRSTGERLQAIGLLILYLRLVVFVSDGRTRRRHANWDRT